MVCLLMSACICVCMPGARESKKRASDSLELELQTSVRQHRGARNLTQVSGRAPGVPNC